MALTSMLWAIIGPPFPASCHSRRSTASRRAHQAASLLNMIFIINASAVQPGLRVRRTRHASGSHVPGTIGTDGHRRTRHRPAWPTQPPSQPPGGCPGKPKAPPARPDARRRRGRHFGLSGSRRRRHCPSPRIRSGDRGGARASPPACADAPAAFPGPTPPAAAAAAAISGSGALRCAPALIPFRPRRSGRPPSRGKRLPDTGGRRGRGPGGSVVRPGQAPAPRNRGRGRRRGRGVALPGGLLVTAGDWLSGVSGWPPGGRGSRFGLNRRPAAVRPAKPPTDPALTTAARTEAPEFQGNASMASAAWPVSSAISRRNVGLQLFDRPGRILRKFSEVSAQGLGNLE